MEVTMHPPDVVVGTVVFGDGRRVEGVHSFPYRESGGVVRHWAVMFEDDQRVQDAIDELDDNTDTDIEYEGESDDYYTSGCRVILPARLFVLK
jgi:hypothetical protein